MSPASPGGVGDDCECTYDPDEWEWHPGDVIPEDFIEVPYLYKRACQMCGRVWWSGHCPHDGIQTRCKGCGWVPVGGRTAMQALGFEPSPPRGDTHNRG